MINTANGAHYKRCIIEQSDVGQPLDPAFIAHKHDMPPMLFTALKKIMEPGARGYKSEAQDINDAIGALERHLELIATDAVDHAKR
jgi:hypothetical protein